MERQSLGVTACMAVALLCVSFYVMRKHRPMCWPTRALLCVCVFINVLAAGFVTLCMLESPLLNVLLGKEATHPPAYFKSFILNLIEQGTAGECRKPGEVKFAGPEVNMVHYIWVTQDPGCDIELKDWYHCAVESVLSHLDGIPVVIWIVQPPKDVLPAEQQKGWQPCDRAGNISVLTRHGMRNVTTRPITIGNSTSLEKWYRAAGNAHMLFTSKLDIQEISDFFRIFVLQQHGGLYMDFDYMVANPRLRFIEDGAGREFRDHRRFGGHAVANSFLKFTKGSPVLDDIAADMRYQLMHDMPHIQGDFSYFGMGSVTRTYLKHRFRDGCEHMQWVAFGRNTVFKNGCMGLETGIFVGLHWKLSGRNENTCHSAVLALRLSCPASLSAYDVTHGYAKL